MAAWATDQVLKHSSAVAVTSPFADDFFVAGDEATSALRRATNEMLNGLLQVPNVGRSEALPHELRAAVRAIAVCPEDGQPFGTVAQVLSSVVFANGVQPGDPSVVAHLHPPTLIASVATDLAVSATNQSMDSWDQSPVATEVELHLMAWLAGVLGFAPGASGVMTPGGTASNVLALTLARAAAAARIGSDVAKEGLPDEARRWRICCSDQAHFSIQRGAAQLGLGRDAVVGVMTTETGAMDPAALDAVLAAMVAAGEIPIAIVATAGTTDLGVIDPLDHIAERARSVGAWFHVDAAVAGAFAMSEVLKGRLAGIEAADSVTIDFHKLWFQPFNASALVVANEERFDLLRVRSRYLDRGDELDGMVNLVGRSLDTSRRFDAAKVLGSLATIGRKRFAAMVEHLVDLASFASSAIQAHDDLVLVAPVTSMMVCFAPRGGDSDLMRQIQQRLLVSGQAVIGRTEIKGQAALKFTFVNPTLEKNDVERLIALIAATARSLRS